jgi:hypothetical protein
LVIFLLFVFLHSVLNLPTGKKVGWWEAKSSGAGFVGSYWSKMDG